jgi:hypothetical protein
MRKKILRALRYNSTIEIKNNYNNKRKKNGNKITKYLVKT